MLVYRPISYLILNNNFNKLYIWLILISLIPMSDIFSSEKRSKIMSKVKGEDTKPEMKVRRYLHSKGFRYRLHQKSLPGSPDLVFKKYNAIIFVNGCFWHGHENCKYAKLPKSRKSYWKNKISKNKKRDKKAINNLLNNSWRVLVIWSCSLKNKKLLEKKLQLVEKWLINGNNYKEISK